MIIVQAPLRISLFGGGTDFPSYFREEGGAVLSSTIDKYIFIIIKKRFDQKIRVGYTQTEMVSELGALQHELIREALKKTNILQGVEVTTMGDIPSTGTGLGSSSTVTVGALQAMYTYLGEIVPPERLAHEACEIEIDILKKPIGVQDQYICAYGGLRFIEFHRDGTVQANRLDLSPELRGRLNDSLLLFYTGVSRKSSSILEEQKNNINGRLQILREMRLMAEVACRELMAGNLDCIGELLNHTWQLKQLLASGITTPLINELYQRARNAGALGGKITGAGGGGFLLLYCPVERRDRVRKALADLQELPFQLEHDGAKVIFNYRSAA